MDLDFIKKQIDYIKKNKDDDENAHDAEDSLYYEFIKYISKRNDELGKMAKQVIKTKNISFSRWCA